MPDERHAGKNSSPGGIEGKYANYFQVGQNAFEFLVDFGQFYSDGRREHFHTRIVTSPLYAKELLRVLHEAIEQHEKSFGPIQEGD